MEDPGIDYDCEFLEEPGRLDLISIALVGPDGREYYAVNRDMPVRRIRRRPWLMENVVPHLPRAHGEERHLQHDWWPPFRPWLFNRFDPCVKPIGQIADEVLSFIRSYPGCALYGWCPAFDHVRLAWLWGEMANLPPGVPYCTRDIGQEAARLGVDIDTDGPERTSGAHHALADARHQRAVRRWLATVAAAQR